MKTTSIKGVLSFCVAVTVTVAMAYSAVTVMAYPFFIGIYVHIMVLYSADVKSHMTGIIVYTVIYACYVILRLRKAALKSRKAKIATA